MFGSHVEHEAAYAAAVKRNIIRNWKKTFYIEHHDAAALAMLIEQGIESRAPLVYREGFLGSCAQAYDDARLSAGQVEKLRTMLAQRAARREEAKPAAAGAGHVGKVGERINVVVEVAHVSRWRDECYGERCALVMKDAAGCVLVYLGGDATARQLAIGARVAIRATVKIHNYRDGTPQTVVQRPKFLTNQPEKQS